MSTGLPPIDQSLMPASVREGGAKAMQTYGLALSFEGLLDEQLGRALADTLQPADGSGDATTSVLTQLLPHALSQGLIAGGGLGLASHLYDSLQGPTS